MRFIFPICLVTFSVFLVSHSDGANILGISHFPSKSHDILMRSLLQALAKQGHKITFVTPFPIKKPTANFTNIELTGILELKDEMMKTATSGQTLSILKMPVHFYNVLKEIVNHEAIRNLIDSNEQYDAVILFWFVVEPFLAIADHFKAPIISFNAVGSTFFITKHTNAPANPSYVPHVFLPYSSNMSFCERSINTAVSVFIDFFYNYIVTPVLHGLTKELLPNSRSVWDILEDIDLYLVNSNIATESPRPYMPNMIQIGGFFMEDVEELPLDLKKFLDEATEGVIYFSFGSNIEPSTLPSTTREAILNTFAKQKMKVLYKYGGSIENLPSNVKVGKWLPQRSILAHPNVKLFITHSGLGGTAEATYFGVPMVGIPFFGDQNANVAKVIADGYGVKVGSTNISETSLSEAIDEVLTNPKYKNNIQLKSMLFRSQPMSQTKKAVYWIEHVIKHKGAKHLKSPSSKMPFYQYYLLDVATFILGILSVFVIINYFILRTCYRCVKGRFCKKNKDVQKKNN